MSSPSIGRAALILSTNYADLTKGLGKAGTETRAWADRLGSDLSGKMKTAGEGAGKVAGSGISAALSRAYAPVAAAAAGLFSVKEILADLKELGKVGSAGRAFGVDPQTFSGMAGIARAAGSDIRDFTEALATLTGRAEEAASGGGKVAAEMFQKLGLDAAQFKALSVDRQFYQIFDALNRVANPAERVQLLMRAFGEDSGKNLLPLLGKSSSELKSMAGAFSLTAQQMAKVDSANKAVAGAGNALNGLWRAVLVSAAPVIELIAKQLLKLAPAFDWIGRAAMAFYGTASAIWTEIIDTIGEAVSSLGAWALEVLGLSGPWPSIEDVITGAFEGIVTAGAYCWDALKAGAGVVAIAISALIKELWAVGPILKGIAELARALPDQVRPEWVDQFANGVDGMAKGIDDTAQGLRNWGNRQLDNFGNSARDAEAWFDRLNAKQAEAGKMAANAAANMPTPTIKYAPNNALVAGTKEELSARIRAEFNASSAAEKQLAEQRRATAVLNQVHGVLQQIADKPPIVLGTI